MNVFLPVVATGTGQVQAQTVTEFGVGIAWQRGPDWAARTLATLRPPVWLNWVYDHLDDPRYLPQAYDIAATPASNKALSVAAADPARLWLLGNEPELKGTYIPPATAAAFSRTWARLVGLNFAAPNIIVDDVGLSWLVEYLHADGVVGNAWGVHIYYCCDADGWLRRWDRWRNWQVMWGMERPTIVTETNAWPGGNQESVMGAIVETLHNDSALSAALWYSDRDWHGVFGEPDLLESDGRLTPLGERFAGWQK